MAGKGLKCKKDEKQDLQKQIGCITGFFQLFDRHRLITNQRTSSNYIQNTPSSGVSNNKTKDLSKMQKTKAKNQEITKEKQQFSKESSITSVSSSSCSSSMSSLEFNRIVKTESSSTKQIQIPKNSHSKVTMNQHDTKNHQSLDFSDIVKDSMHREAKGLLHVKTFAKQEKKGHIDSPRPMLAHKSFNAGVMVSNEPINSLLKSKRAPWDSPRLSYDGRYVQDTLKSNTKHKELLPRLSLDSKQGSVRVISEGNKARNVLNGLQKEYERNSTTKTSSGVVAKLMGLEVIPDMTIQTFVTSSRSTEQKELMGRSRTSGEYKKHQSSDIITTNVKPYSRFALESTASSSYLLQDSKGSDSDIKASKSSLSVYGEIEKRLTELEFKKSGKDLRALKQILEAMQRYTDSSSSDSRNNNTTSLIESSKVQSSRTQQKVSETVAVETWNSIRSSKLPIVVMKPTKVTRKANIPPSTELSIHDKSCLSKCSSTNGRLIEKQKAKTFGLTTKNSKDTFGQSAEKNSYLRTSKLMQSSKSSHECNGKNSTNSGNVTVTGSPRLQKKFGFERRSTPTSPSSDSIINRRQHNMQLVEFSSSNSTPRQDFSILQARDESFKHHVNVISSDYDRKRSLATRSDIKVVSINQNNTFEEMRKERSKADKTVTAEQPSPVSVLDAAFYKEDPPSPVKNISNISKKLGESLSTDDDSEENSNANLSNGFVEKDTNTDNVARIRQEIECFDEKLINFNNIKNPDHKYISEILLTSGLFNYHSSIKLLHSQGHLINPKLFLALEQMKTNKAHFNIEDDAEKMQRKLIFDVVNEILVKKLILENSTSFWYLPKLKGKMLLEEICEEIDELQRENRDASFVHEDENLIHLLCSDLKNHNTVWTDYCGEKPNIGLDIERSIFKDLITEVVRDELATHFGDHCRKMLFS